MLYYNVKIDASAVDGKTKVFSQSDSFYVKADKEFTVKDLMDEAVKKLRYDSTYLALDKEEIYIKRSSFRNKEALKLTDKIVEKEEYLYYIELKPKAK
jgi:hypothetical protein